MPVIRRRNHDGVDVLASQEFAEVVIEFHALERAVLYRGRVLLLNLFLGRSGSLLHDVADGDDLHVRMV